MLGFNIRSFNANHLMFESFLGSLSVLPDVVVLSETWNDGGLSTMYNISNYDACHTIRSNRAGGGVSIYVTKGYSFRRIDRLCICNSTIEVCVIEINSGGSLANSVIFAIYRPHTDSIVNFTDAVSNLLQSELLLRKKIYLLGDFNINLLADSDASVEYFSSCLRSLSFLPYITQPTRFASNDASPPSLLDHIMGKLLRFT